jgi:hypothetical protein
MLNLVDPIPQKGPPKTKATALRYQIVLTVYQADQMMK